MIEIGTAHHHRDTPPTTTTSTSKHLQSPSPPPRPIRSPPNIPTTTIPTSTSTTITCTVLQDNQQQQFKDHNNNTLRAPPVRLVPSASASTRISKKLWSGTIQPQQMNQRNSSPPQSCDTNLSDTTTTTTPIASTTTTKRRLPKFWQQQHATPTTSTDSAKPPSSSFSLRSLKQRAEEGVAKRSLFSQKANPTNDHAAPLNKQQQQQSHVVYRRHASVPAPGCSILNAPSTLEQALSRIRRQYRQQDTTSALENLRHVISLLDRHPYYRKRLASRRERFDSLCEDNLEDTMKELESACKTHPVSHIDMVDPQRFTLELPQCILDDPPPDYTTAWPEHLDTQASWFRHHFVGKPYTTLIRRNEANDNVMVISVVYDDDASSCTCDLYRVIIRSNDSQYAGHYLVESPPSSAMPMAAAQVVYMAQPALDLSEFQELSVETTILTGIEKELLRLDEIDATRHHKFGVLTVQEGQSTEQAWFSNTGLTPNLERLLETIGTRVELRGYQGYTAGLDTRAGESGTISYASRWRNHDVMFHVAALMPLRTNDAQQVHRKRHIGNDIVCLVLVEGNAKFDPSKIRSQFLHIFIVLQPILGTDQWSVQVIRNTNVQTFGPTIPDILGSDQLRDFLLLKMINGKCAAVKSEKFARPSSKARAGILCNIAQMVPPPPSVNSNSPSPSPPSADLTPTPSRSTLLKRGFTRRRRRTSGNGGTTTQPALIPEEDEDEQHGASSTRSRAHNLVSNMIHRGGSGSSSNNNISRSKTYSRRPNAQTSLKRNNTAKTS